MPIIKGRRASGHPVTLTTTAPPATATSYTLAEGAISGLTGVADVLTLAPVGGVWPSATVTLAVSGVTYALSNGSGGSLSGGVLTPPAGTTTSCTVNMTPSATGTATISATNSGTMTNPGSLTYAVSSSGGGTLAASRYDILVSDASGDTSTARTVSAVPNGTWSGGSITLTAAKTGGTSSVGTLTLPSSGNATQTASWTPPSVGEWTISGTNTASLHNPFSPLYVCFAASAGTARTISANSSYFLDQTPFQQDAWTGTPAGFTAINGATFGMGWGSFQIKVTPSGASAALYGQLFDSDSSGATTTANTGTAVSNATQIYGAVTGGSEITINANQPSSEVTYYLDVATDSAMTNRARIPLRFRITDVVAIDSRSMECMWLQDYGYSTPPGTTWSTYTKTMCCYSPGPSSFANGTWTRADGTGAGPVGAQEAGRRFFNKKGHGCALVGLAQAGGNMDDHFNPSDGSPYLGFSDAVSRVNGKFRYMKLLDNEWTGYSVAESLAEYQDAIPKIINNLITNHPALAVIAFGTASGWYGNNGSMKMYQTGFNGGSSYGGIGYGRLAVSVVRPIEAANPMVVSADADVDWNEWGGSAGHATRASQTRFVRSGVLAMLMADGTHAGGYGFSQADRYATFASTGTISGDELHIPFTLPAGATGLVMKRWENGTTGAGFTYSTPNPVDLIDVVAVYVGPNGWSRGPNNATIKITGASVDNANSRFVITLDRSGGAGTVKYVDGGAIISTPAEFDVQLFADFWFSGPQHTDRGIGVFDNRSTLDDYGFGAHVRPQLDVVCS